MSIFPIILVALLSLAVVHLARLFTQARELHNQLFECLHTLHRNLEGFSDEIVVLEIRLREQRGESLRVPFFYSQTAQKPFYTTTFVNPSF